MGSVLDIDNFSTMGSVLDIDNFSELAGSVPARATAQKEFFPPIDANFREYFPKGNTRKKELLHEPSPISPIPTWMKVLNSDQHLFHS